MANLLITDKLNSGQTPDSAAITTSSSVAVPANRGRRWLYLTNIGVQDAFLAFGQTALVSKGIVLGRLGGALIIDATNLNFDSVNAITLNGTTTIAFQEGI